MVDQTKLLEGLSNSKPERAFIRHRLFGLPINHDTQLIFQLRMPVDCYFFGSWKGFIMSKLSQKSYNLLIPGTCGRIYRYILYPSHLIWTRFRWKGLFIVICLTLKKGETLLICPFCRVSELRVNLVLGLLSINCNIQYINFLKSYKF